VRYKRPVQVVLLFASFAVLLAGALLFTNAIEWLGHRLGLGQSAVGSLLAAVATALPESIIPVVALITDAEGSGDVAVGAILGAPFMLATIAMALVGVSAFAYRRRRRAGAGLDVHVPTLQRDLGFFLAFFALALLVGIGLPDGLRWLAAVLFVAAYVAYVVLTLRGSGAVQEEETLKPLIMDTTRHDPPTTLTIVVQILVALGAIVGGAHLFVHELLDVAERIGMAPLLLALVLAPLATELPEKANSFFWMRESKDSLALGNITGAMVFQSTLPVAIGVAFSDWDLEGTAFVAGGLGLAGGLLAIYFLQLRRRFTLPAVLVWAALWAAFVVYVAAIA